ncbi:MAG: hypothetical protein IJB52_02905 [Clostridia bacterium]|nr:hypothetical protein [Clostridia bacterium]
MNNKVCFILEGKELYIDEVFVDFNELPIYFSCISDDKYYLALCCEYDNQDYVLVESSVKEIIEMLTARITIRSTFTKKTKHWVVVAGEDITKDKISLIHTPYLDENILPKEGAKYAIVTEKVKQYLKRIEHDLYRDESYTTIATASKQINDRDTQFEHFEIITPIEFYTRYFASKTNGSNISKTTHEISFSYEKDDHYQSNVASKESLDYDRAFGLKNIEDRSIAA